MSRPPRPEDPGLAVERTVMAWGRTSLGLAALAALLVRFGAQEHVEAPAYAVAALAMLAAGLGWWASLVGYREGRLPFLSPGRLRAFGTITTVVFVGSAATVIAGLV